MDIFLTPQPWMHCCYCSQTRYLISASTFFWIFGFEDKLSFPEQLLAKKELATPIDCIEFIVDHPDDPKNCWPSNLKRQNSRILDSYGRLKNCSRKMIQTTNQKISHEKLFATQVLILTFTTRFYLTVDIPSVFESKNDNLLRKVSRQTHTFRRKPSKLHQ